MKLICLMLVVGLFQISCLQKAKVENWIEVKSDKGGFLVECPKKTNSTDLVTVEYDDKKKSGYLNCVTNEIVFFVHTSEWNVSENPQENSDRFFETLPSTGIGDSSEIALSHQGKKGLQDIDTEFQSIGQHFIIDKTAFHLKVTFPDTATGQAKTGRLDDEQIKLAKRFFDSFRLLKN